MKVNVLFYYTFEQLELTYLETQLELFGIHIYILPTTYPQL